VLRLFLAAARPLYAGARVVCPCCGGRFRAFVPYRIGGAHDSICPRCGSLRRTRLLLLYLRERTNLFQDALRVLHVAPEAGLQDLLRAVPTLDYTSIDLDSPIAMHAMDVTDLRYEDHRFDVILCSHVLEHVIDDRKAMREFFRVLRPGGWAIIQSPVRRDSGTTVEDPTVVSPRDRARLFGQPDHVRLYGRDYVERLADAGFMVTVDRYAEETDEDTLARHGLRRSMHAVYLCAKPSTTA
jgi:SAM-dependent methyltransferase